MRRGEAIDLSNTAKVTTAGPYRHLAIDRQYASKK
jgi:hypothetical protein